MKIVPFIVLILIATSFPAQAQDLTIINSQVKPGGILVVKASQNSSITVFGKRYQANVDGFIFVGIDLTAQPGSYSLEGQVFQIEELRAKVRRRVPSRLTAKRKKELELLARYYSSADEFAWMPEGIFSQPLPETIVTSDFAIGHSGVDLRASRRTPVQAINDGRVLMVARLSLEGNMVVVDHGSGVLSLYLHLTQASVREGIMVKKGQVIGLSGATGAVTGPHLHFMVKVGGVNVDPLEFIETMNTLFPEGIPR